MHYWALLAGAGALLYLSARRERINPASAFFFTWTLQFVLLALPIFDYYQDAPTWIDVAYISAALAVAFLGFRWGGMAAGEHHEEPAALWLVHVLALAGVVGQVAVIFNTTFLTGIEFPHRVTGGVADLIRQMHFENLEESRIPPFPQAEFWLSPLSYVVLALYFLIEPRFLRQGRVAQAGVLASFGMIATNALFSYGGRFTIALAVVVVIAAKIMRGQKLFTLRPKAALGIALVAILGWYFSVDYIQKRTYDADPVELLQLAQRADLQPIAKAAAESDAVGFGFLALSYFATPTPTLVRYLHLDKGEMPGPYYGEYCFPIVAQRVSRYITGKAPQPWWEMRKDIFHALTGSGFAGNVWATGMRDLVVDFGRYGALAVLFVLTLASGWVHASAKTGSIAMKALACFLLFGWLWFPFHVPTLTHLFFMPLLLLSGWIFAWAAWRWTLDCIRSPASSEAQ